MEDFENGAHDERGGSFARGFGGASAADGFGARRGEGGAPAPELHKVLFVCHGNICRSPMAQYVMQHLVDESGLTDAFALDSAATTMEEIGHAPHPETRRVLEEHGIPCGNHKARLIRRIDGKKWDLIVIMDEENLVHLRHILAPEDMAKVFKLMSFTGLDRDVADPWYTGNFEVTFADVWRGCNALFENIMGTSAERLAKR